MYNNNRDTEEVLLYIKKATMFMDPAMKLLGLGTIKLFQLFARMIKEGKLSQHEFKDFQEFAKLTEGKFSLVNIPIESDGSTKFLGAKSFGNELDELKKEGIRFSIMPDLNKEDNFVQLAVMDEDREKFRAWNQRYLMKRMGGGEHNLASLEALTSGQTSLISIPFEGKEKIFQNDFQTLGINYSILPDLKVGDGQIQLVIANSDMQKVEHWYKLYQEKRLRQGESIPDMNPIDMDTYQKTGDMTPDEYMETAADDIKEMNQKYEREPGTFEKMMSEKESIIQSDENVAYSEFENDLRYQKFTINDGTLVQPIAQSQTGKMKMQEFGEKGYFISRIPGTMGKDVQYLVIEKEQVFVSKDGQTYTAFLDKSKKPMVFDDNFKLVAGGKRKFTEELFKNHYDLSSREQNLTQSIRNAAPKKAANKAKSPTVPLKTK